MTRGSNSDFEQRVLPSLGAAYSLARWLMRHPQDAEDAVQEAVLRAYRSYGGFAGGNAQAWLLAIVRNTCLTTLERRRAEGKIVVLSGSGAGHERLADVAPDPAPLADAAIISDEERRRVHAAIAELPLSFREVLVLREFHDLNYRQIADVVGAPVGTVMSRLARARERVAAALQEQKPKLGTGSKS